MPCCWLTSKARRAPSGDHVGCETLPGVEKTTRVVLPVIVEYIKSCVCPVPVGSPTNASRVPSGDHVRLFEMVAQVAVSWIDAGDTLAFKRGELMAISSCPSLRIIWTLAFFRSI